MTNSSDRRPFSMPYVGYVSNITGTNVNNPVMISRAPWPQPVGKYFVLRKLVATFNGNQLMSGGVLNVWDQDLSNTTPVGRGSGGGPLMVVPIVPAGLSGAVLPSATILDVDACPQQYFQAGVTVQTAISGISVTFEADVV